MKDSIRIIAIGIGLAGCMGLAMFLSPADNHLPASLSDEEISWVEFCKAKGYSIHTQDEEIINEFIFTWRGSAEEEEALSHNGAQA